MSFLFFVVPVMVAIVAISIYVVKHDTNGDVSSMD